MSDAAPAAAPAPAQRLGLAERLSYGLGDIGFSLAYNMASGFLLYYYTNVVGLPATAVGAIFLAARLLDAVIDILVGIAVDRTQSRWGRARPYFLFTALPYALTFVLVFAVPDWGVNAQLVYAFVTFKALGILMSLGAIPYTALMPMMTSDTGERLKLGGMRSIGTSLSVVIGTAATMPLVGLFGGGDEQRGFLGVAVLYGLIGLVAVYALFRNCRERIAAPAGARQRIGPVIGEMLRNRAWVVAFLFCLFYFIRFGAMMAETAYLAIDVLGQPWMISVMLPAISGMLLLSAFFAPPILARTGLRNGCVAILLVSALLFAILPLTEGNTALFLAVYFAAALATSLTITAAFTMIAETVDYHEWKFGSRNEGILSAGVSLATKVGMAIGTSAIAFLLGYVEYAPGHVTDAAREAIRWSYYGGAVALLLIQAVVAWYWPQRRSE
ncbi:MAG: glycoside-pentoside-hexuronide (GPH):cation symporter [Sphingomonadaceae bacterium]